MDKAKIEFLIKNGFTIDEIMKLESESKPEPETKPETKQETKTETKPETKTESDNIAKMLSDLKSELTEMRNAMHTENRLNTAIDKQQKQTSFEEDIETMISEVTN